MPIFVAALLGGLINIAGTVAGRVLLSLGFAAVTYTGLSTSMAFLKTQAVNSFSGLSPTVLGMLSTMKVGECISIITSAMLAKAVLNGLTGDTMKRLVQK